MLSVSLTYTNIDCLDQNLVCYDFVCIYGTTVMTMIGKPR